MKNVKSSDPRKAKIVAALKKKSGGGKVTLVKESTDGHLFEGYCFKFTHTPVTKRILKMRTYWHSLGKFEVTAQEAGL